MQLSMKRMDRTLVAPSRNESIAVIGGGIAGCLTAEALASTGYDVSLFEAADNLMIGTSANAVQAHLGGLYPGSPETARECLRAAIALKKTLPQSLNERTISYLVADESPVSLDEYLTAYQGLREYYGSLPASDQVFGRPEDFYRALPPTEYGYAKNVQGGIATKEPGLNMDGARQALTTKLAAHGVKVFTNTEVVAATPQSKRFNLQLKSAQHCGKIAFDQVVNTSGYNSLALDSQLGYTGTYYAHLKAWNVGRPAGDLATRAPFAVVSGGFIHYSPIGQEGLACLLAPREGGSYINTVQCDSNNPSLPDEWLTMLRRGSVSDAASHAQRVLDFAGDTFLRNPQFETQAVIPGVAVSYSHDLQNRTGGGLREIVPGWFTAVPTKATTAVPLAHVATQAVIAHSAAQSRPLPLAA
jgi:glycine/D-amino acid oxidase-like deaminating enzyme